MFKPSVVSTSIQQSKHPSTINDSDARDSPSVGFRPNPIWASCVFRKNLIHLIESFARPFRPSTRVSSKLPKVSGKLKPVQVLCSNVTSVSLTTPLNMKQVPHTLHQEILLLVFSLLRRRGENWKGCATPMSCCMLCHGAARRGCVPIGI